MTFIITILKLVIILGVVTTIHEFGHFICSKMFKIGVNEFSIGFGPKIFQKKYKETMYSVRWIPLGGYCAIEGEGEASDSENSFEKKNVFEKFIVLVAGATFNALLSIAIFMVIAFSVGQMYNTKITKISDDSALLKAGIKEGDTIYAINDKKVSLATELVIENYNKEANDIKVSYIRDGVEKEVVVKDAVKDIGYIGVSFLISEDGLSGLNEIDMVAAGGVASKADLKAGDKIISVNGIKTDNSSDVIAIIRENAGKQIELNVDRKGETITKTLTPTSKKIVEFGIISTELTNVTVPLAIDYTVNNIKTILASYVELFKGNVKIDEMSGIVGIGEVVSKTSGVLSFFNLMAIISLAVGIANILPFPPLDGGKIVIVFGEAITRKKLPLKAEAFISYLGFGLLILLTIFVTYKDIIRII